MTGVEALVHRNRGLHPSALRPSEGVDGIMMLLIIRVREADLWLRTPIAR